LDNLVEVTVLVPRHKLAKFYIMHGRLLKDRLERDGRFGGGEGHRGRDFRGHGPARVSLLSPAERSAAWAEGTEEQRLADAREYYTTLSDTARKFLDILIDDSRSEIPAGEMIEKLGLESNRVLAGSLSSFGRKARRIGRVQPFGFVTDAEGSTIYYLPEDVAELFGKARS
jgi:hypothetical protein